MILAEGYVGQEKLEHAAPDVWEKILSAHRKNVIIQGVVGAVENFDASRVVIAHQDVDQNGVSSDGAEAALKNGVLLDGEAAESSDALMPDTVPCLVIWFDRIRGIVPFPESGTKDIADMRGLIGQFVAFKVKSVDEKGQTFLASRREALEEMAAATWSALAVGQKRVAVVRSVTPYRALVDIGGVVASLPAREVSYYWVNDVRDYLKVCDTFDVKVVDVDRENQSVKVSLRALQPDPWDTPPEEGSRRLGTVAGITDRGGVIINAEPGFICSAQKPKFENYVPGDRVVVKILNVNREKRRIYVRIVEKRNIAV